MPSRHAQLAEAIREHRAALGLETRLVIRNPDGDDQYPEEVALLVAGFIDAARQEGYEQGQAEAHAWRDVRAMVEEATAEARVAALAEATAAIKARLAQAPNPATDTGRDIAVGLRMALDEVRAALAALAPPPAGGDAQ